MIWKTYWKKPKAEIRTDLVVVGKGWWLERYKYNYSEWWVYKAQPKLLKNHKELDKLSEYDRLNEHHKHKTRPNTRYEADKMSQ